MEDALKNGLGLAPVGGDVETVVAEIGHCESELLVVVGELGLVVIAKRCKLCYKQILKLKRRAGGTKKRHELVGWGFLQLKAVVV